MKTILSNNIIMVFVRFENINDLHIINLNVLTSNNFYYMKQKLHIAKDIPTEKLNVWRKWLVPNVIGVL